MGMQQPSAEHSRDRRRYASAGHPNRDQRKDEMPVTLDKKRQRKLALERHKKMKLAEVQNARQPEQSLHGARLKYRIP